MEVARFLIEFIRLPDNIASLYPNGLLYGVLPMSQGQFLSSLMIICWSNRDNIYLPEAKMRRVIIIILLVFFVFGCSSIKDLTKRQKEAFVRANLSYLNTFKSQGILEISVKGFTLKKEFVLKKNHDSLRLDVLDSGIMSLLPSPFATLYVNEQILLTNYNKGFFPDIVQDKFPLKEFFDLEKLPQGIIDEIVKNRKFTIAILQFEFDDLYRMNKIIINNDVITFKYIANDLVKIELESSKADIKIDFDSFETGEFPIKPLEIINNEID